MYHSPYRELSEDNCSMILLNKIIRFALTGVAMILFVVLGHNVNAQCTFPINITYTPNIVKNGQAVQFSSTISGGTAPYAYSWDFGDGNTNSLANPVNTYLFNGACADTFYVLDVLISDINGCTALHTDTITVAGLSQPELFDQDTLTPFSNCESNPTLTNPNFLLTLLNGSVDSSLFVYYTIDWGDGSPLETINNSSFPISHQYLALGNFPIVITGYDSTGCSSSNQYVAVNQSNPAVGISSLGSTVGCTPQTFSFVLNQYQLNSPGTVYEWDFGDGSPVVTWTYGQPFINDTIYHTYVNSSCGMPGNSFTVTVTAMNQCDATSASVSNIIIYAPGIPSFVSDTIVCVDDTVQFNNNSTPGYGFNCTQTATYTWDFGDSTTSSLTNPTHSYGAPGTYTVTLQMGNTVCPPQIYTQNIQVIEGPELYAMAAPLSGCIPHTVNFSDTSTGQGLSYLWTVTPTTGWAFSGSSTSTSQDVSIDFTTIGTYQVTHEVSNICATEDTIFTISANGAPTASINSISDTCGSKTLIPDANIYDNGDPVTSVEWFFQGGNPSYSTALNPGQVIYPNPGTYQVILVVNNNCGTDTAYASFTVFSTPVLNITASDDTICAGNPVTLNVSGASSYLWLSGGISNPTAASVQINPVTSGYYVVEGSVTGGCSSTDSIYIEVINAPMVNLIATPSHICLGDTISLTASGTSTYNWIAGQNYFSTAGANVTAGPTNNSVFTVIGTDNNGCSDSASVNILVNQAAINVSASSTSICQGDSTILTASGANTYVWSPSNGLSATFGSVVSASPLNTTTYLVSSTDTLGCAADTQITITVHANPIVTLSTSADTICEGDSIVLTAGGGQTYNWFVNGNPLTPASAAITAAPVVNTQYLVIGTDANLCTGTDTIDITVNPLPQFQANASSNMICIGDSVNIDAIGNYTYSWAGSNYQANGSNGIIAWPSTVSQYDILAENQFGCQADTSIVIGVDSIPAISVNFDTVVCVNSNVLFTNNTLNANSYSWSFGDGNTSSAVSPTHAYLTTGFYPVSLTAINNTGCSDSISGIIEVIDVPSASFTALPDSGCGPLSVTLTSTSTGNISSYLWNFGNGNTSTATQGVQVFAAPVVMPDTTYTVSLTTGNICGSTTVNHPVTVIGQPVSDFGVSPASGCSPLTVNIGNISTGAANYVWDFGDGTTSAVAQPGQHQYFAGTADTIYYISLVTSNACGSDTLVKQVLVHPNQLNAVISGSPTSGCAPLTVSFNNYSNSSANIYWNFDDGNFSNSVNPVHTYTNPGIYNAYLSIDDGCSADTAYLTIEVYANPNLSFVQSADTVCAGSSVTFTNTSATTLNAIEWDFGEGTTSLLSNPVHQYAIGGTYTIWMKGTAQGGCMDSVQKTIFVFDQPQAGFTMSDTAGCQDFTVSFQNTSNGNFSQWIFGDGNSSVQTSPVHTYTASGNFNIVLITSNSFGCADTAFNSLTVYPKPVSAFSTLNPPMSCGYPITIGFDNNSTGAMSYEWDFGNGLSSTATSPSVTYTAAANYNIILIAMNQFGCTDTNSSVFFSVYEQPTASFTLDENEGCMPLQIAFTNQSTNALTYTWSFGDGNVSSLADPINVFDTAGSYSVMLIATGAGGCADTIVINDPIDVYPIPYPDFTFTHITPPLNSGIVQFNNTTPGINDHSYIWNMGDGTSKLDTNPVHTYGVNGGYYIELMATNQYGCTNTMEHLLEIDFVKGLFFPNAFAPNHPNDGVRYFKPVGTGLKEYYVAVYDAWGNKIWESNKVVDGAPGEFWDGTINGEPAPADVYVWKATAIFDDNTVWPGLEIGVNSYNRHGTVTLIR